MTPQFEPMESRTMFSVTGTFDPGASTLLVLGDSKNNNITVSRDAAGNILVNGGNVQIAGGTPTVGNTSKITVLGLAGNDKIQLDETNGALPAASLNGGTGNDSLVGGSGNDKLVGGFGNDDLQGKDGTDLLFGSAGNDTLTGGKGDDQAFGEAGDDRMIWNPAEGTDLNEGGDGNDTVEINGGAVAETFSATPNGDRVRFDRTDPAPFSIDIGTSENLVLNMAGGDDTFNGSVGLKDLIKLNVDGGAGNDTINGGDGDDQLLGGDGNDVIDGNKGADTALMGNGNDTFIWDPGEGSDIVEGQAGTDKLLFNGADGDEDVLISANGKRVTFFRNPANITMDMDDVEIVNFVAKGGADHIVVNDLSGTDLRQVSLDLTDTDGGEDTVVVNGTKGKDNVVVAGSGTTYSVSGLFAKVNVKGSDGTKDNLQVNTLENNDNIDASGLDGGVVSVSIDGGAGNDKIAGSQGDDRLVGGEGNDAIDGNKGADVAAMGAGDDAFTWDPGDGSDIVEGDAGNDRMIFNGSSGDEIFDASNNGGRLRFFRNLGNIVMDVDGVERVDLNALGGADTTTVNDLTGTDVTTININLAGPDGKGDGAADAVIVGGTGGDDTVTVSGDRKGISIDGLVPAIKITGSEIANDSLTIFGLAGDDGIDASALADGAIKFTANGGDGDDFLLGSAGNDSLVGEAGDDILVGNAGLDVLDGGAGSNVVIQ